MNIAFDDENILLTHEGRTAPIPWDSVESVFVYKQDLVIVDRIVTLIKIDGDLDIEVDEEMQGWKPLVDAMPKYLPNCRDFADWFMDVAFPAFEAKPMLIYKRLRPGDVQ